MILGIVETLEEWIKPFKDFIFKNTSNPLMWLAFLVVGVLIFKWAYDSLNKNH